MFGRRKREEAAAAEVAREDERRALFAKLASRPEHICPFLGLEADRTGYVEGVSDDHRCFAFGDPASISAEQQTRVCQERGYGNCPRYLRGVLVIPTEELEALRRPRAALPPPPVPEAVADPERRRRAPLLVLLALLLLVGGVGAYLVFGRDPGTAVNPSPTATPSGGATSSAVPTTSAAASPSADASPSAGGSPTPEPTPQAGDSFAFYEVSVGPGSYTLYELDNGAIVDELSVGFDQFSFARVEARQGDDGEAYWLTLDGDLAGFAYRFPDSGDFRIRAVFLNAAGDRRSAYLDEGELGQVPQATPAP
ncbi:MAG TPA: hypothetical protein VEW95_03790 [Candidatus Limnocylindrales bacterium]|nr:hypothetical protein [Candidatus Limnocylindrales bacterium]